MKRRPRRGLSRTVYKATRANTNRAFYMEYLMSHPCVDCGCNNILALEADHVGQKSAAISTILKNCSLDKLKIELTECEIRCANCHRIRHSINTWRTKDLSSFLPRQVNTNKVLKDLQYLIYRAHNFMGWSAQSSWNGHTIKGDVFFIVQREARWNFATGKVRWPRQTYKHIKTRESLMAKRQAARISLMEKIRLDLEQTEPRLTYEVIAAKHKLRSIYLVGLTAKHCNIGRSLQINASR